MSTKPTKKQVDELQNALEEVTRERDAFLKLSKRPVKVDIKAAASSDKSEATAIVLFSDWHFEEEVHPATVFHRNKYNLSVAEQRAKECFTKTARLIRKEQQDVVIKECLVGLLGDFITGSIHEENLETCLLRPVSAIQHVRNVLHSGILYLLANTDVMFTFVCAVGNHSRITKKVRSSTEQGNSLEWGLYHQLANDFAKEPRVRFVLEEAYHTYIKVYGRMLRFHHGHNVRYWGGVGGLTIPLNKAIAQWNNLCRADYDFLGHHHQFTLHNNFVVNGSMIGFNGFSIVMKAPFEKPKQAFVLLDKTRGLTVSMPIMFSV